MKKVIIGTDDEKYQAFGVCDARYGDTVQCPVCGGNAETVEAMHPSNAQAGYGRLAVLHWFPTLRCPVCNVEYHVIDYVGLKGRTHIYDQVGLPSV
jgi:hypothetical protein